MELPSLKEIVKGKIYFSFYRDDKLWYKTEVDGFEFPIPLAEIRADSSTHPTFLAEDKGIYFMRYIRKYLATLQEELERHKQA